MNNIAIEPDNNNKAQQCTNSCCRCQRNSLLILIVNDNVYELPQFRHPSNAKWSRIVALYIPKAAYIVIDHSLQPCWSVCVSVCPVHYVAKRLIGYGCGLGWQVELVQGWGSYTVKFGDGSTGGDRPNIGGECVWSRRGLFPKYFRQSCFHCLWLRPLPCRLISVVLSLDRSSVHVIVPCTTLADIGLQNFWYGHWWTQLFKSCGCDVLAVEKTRQLCVLMTQTAGHETRLVTL